MYVCSDPGTKSKVSSALVIGSIPRTCAYALIIWYFNHFDVSIWYKGPGRAGRFHWHPALKLLLDRLAKSCNPKHGVSHVSHAWSFQNP